MGVSDIELPIVQQTSAEAVPMVASIFANLRTKPIAYRGIEIFTRDSDVWVGNRLGTRLGIFPVPIQDGQN